MTMEDAILVLALGLIPVATAGCMSVGLLVRLLSRQQGGRAHG